MDPLLDTDHPDYGQPETGAWPADRHRFDPDSDRCSCGGVVVFFEDGDQNGEIGEGCEAADLVWPRRCGICGEWIDPHEEQAEMYDPADVTSASRIIHAECGLARGWEVA